jgi:hypothetical protein
MTIATLMAQTVDSAEVAAESSGIEMMAMLRRP